MVIGRKKDRIDRGREGQLTGDSLGGFKDKIFIYKFIFIYFIIMYNFEYIVEKIGW